MPTTFATQQTGLTAHQDNGAKQYIVSTKSTCNGQARVDGTRIRVWDIYWWYERDGRSVDQIVADFPQLNHAQVHAALTYYWEHRLELHQHDEEMSRRLDEYMSMTPSKLLAKLATRDDPQP